MMDEEAAHGTGANDTGVHLPDDTIAEILGRLSDTSVLRSGAVCKAWRRVTTDPHFLAARSRRNPASILLYTLRHPDAGRSLDLVLEALPVSCDEAGRRRLVQYPRSSAAKPSGCNFLASCDGVLLLSKKEGFYYYSPKRYLLCNPVTRQWAELPRLPNGYSSDNTEYAFYFHKPSGEFRLLCRHADRIWFIVSTGTDDAKPRRVNLDAEAAALASSVPSLKDTVTTPVALHGNLHWPPQGGSMVAFNTESETFHRMPGPRTTPARNNKAKLFQLNGMLVAADFGEVTERKYVDLFFLKDYVAGMWERRHRVAVPWQPGRSLMTTAAAGDDEQNIVILGDGHALVVYDVRRKTVRAIDTSMDTNNVIVTRHVFKGSLI
ncbi:hypothetical protein EJB05_56097, partial [Eragrostis curvula]